MKDKIKQMMLKYLRFCDYEASQLVWTTIGFYLIVNGLESILEYLLFGESFIHWLDLIIGSLVMVWIFACSYLLCGLKNRAYRNLRERGGNEKENNQTS